MSGLVFWMSELIFGVSGLVFGVSGLVSGMSELILWVSGRADGGTDPLACRRAGRRTGGPDCPGNPSLL